MIPRSGNTVLAAQEDELAEFRNLFPLLQTSVYLNSCAKGPLCTPVRQAYEDFLRDWDQYGAPWQLWMEKAEELRAEFARFIGAKPHEVALTLSASSGADSIASALEYGKRSMVLLSDQEYPTMAQIWLAQRTCGADVQFVRSNGSCPTPQDYARLVDGNTLIAPLTHVSFRNGSTLPVKEITEICHRSGAYVLVDDYQCTGTRPIDVKDLGVDFLVTGMLKYMLGPPGLAFIYVREELIPSLEPRVTGWFGRQDPFSLDIRSVNYADSARRFETGTFPVGAIYASLAALRVIVSMGPARIAKQVATLTQTALQPLRDMGFNVTTPVDSPGPMVAIETDEVQSLLAYLAKNNIVIAGRNNLFRISFHGFNTIAETNTLLATVAEWAGGR
jgi:selenocysteine lyase/cysteine desulfurase